MRLKLFLTVAFAAIAFLLIKAFSPQGKNRPPQAAPQPESYQVPNIGTGPSDGAVTFTSSLDNPYYRLDKTDRHATIYLETLISKFINEKAKRTPLNLSIVIDRSGSMQGDKLANAKKAAIYMIQQLKPEDYISIVAYDDQVTVLQHSVGVNDKAALISKINSIQTSGSTNLWGGTSKGYEEVKANYKSNYVNRVLLLSDGLANAGVTDNNAIAFKVQQFKDKEGITLSTFGLGLDYNETLMTDMAETGNGNYYFIDAPDKLAAIFDKELNGLLNVAAQNAIVQVTLPQGTSLEKAYNFKYIAKGNVITFSLRDLFSEETKGIMINCKLDDHISGNLTFLSSIEFDNVSDGRHITIKNENILSPTGDANLYTQNFNEKVLEQVILNTANENMEKAMAETDKGNYIGAQSIMTSNAAYLKSNAAAVSKSKELQRMDSVSFQYSTQMQNADKMDEMQIKGMQKATKSVNYKVRAKKN